MNKEIVKQYVVNTLYENTYLRPFVLKNNKSQINCFIVGINPATKITTDQISIDEYIELLFDNEKFRIFYTKIRLSENKTALSKTRNNFEKFIRKIDEKNKINIYETNVITYPTKNEDELKLVPSIIKNKSIKVFFELLNDIKPEIVLLHGAKTKNIFFEKIDKNKITVLKNEKQERYLKYDHDKTGLILEAKHFMYYGEKSEHFISVLNRLELEIKSKNLTTAST